MNKSYNLGQLRGAFGAGRAMAERDETVVHKWFHVIENGKMERQGRILSEQSTGFYLVEWLSWITGSPNGQQLVSIEDMSNWIIYSSAEDMRRAHISNAS